MSLGRRRRLQCKVVASHVVAIATHHCPKTLMAFDMELSKRIFLAVDGEVATLLQRLAAIGVGLVVQVLCRPLSDVHEWMNRRKDIPICARRERRVRRRRKQRASPYGAQRIGLSNLRRRHSASLQQTASSP